MLVANNQVKSSSFLAQPLDGHLRVTWKLGRADTADYTIKTPVFTLPFSVTRPFIVGGIPFFVTFQTQTLFTIAITAKTGIIEGGAELDYDGQAVGASTGGTLTTEGAEKVAGQFLSAAGSLTLASSAAVLAFNLPKITVGIGLPGTINGTADLDVITSLGQTTGSAVAGQSCSKYDLDFTVKTGLGARRFKSVRRCRARCSTTGNSAERKEPGLAANHPPDGSDETEDQQDQRRPQRPPMGRNRCPRLGHRLQR